MFQVRQISIEGKGRPLSSPRPRSRAEHKGRPWEQAGEQGGEQGAEGGGGHEGGGDGGEEGRAGPPRWVQELGGTSSAETGLL